MRNIFIVNATQVVVSESHPEGLFSVMSGYPKSFDSNSYEGNIDLASRAAKAEYYSRLSANYAGSANRVMTTVTLTNAKGELLERNSIGEFPTQEPEEEVEPAEE